MTETPKTPQNPLEFLAAALGGNPKAGSEGTSGPVVFDLFGGAPRSGNAGGVEELFGLFDHITKAGAKPSDAEQEPRKPETPVAEERPVAKEDTTFQIGLAGIPKENIFIEVQADVLVVKAVVPNDVRVHASREIVREKPLPQNIDVAKITSTYKDGLLTINLPAIKPTKVRIDISEG